MMMAQPGKKMIFMGMEIGQYSEWNHDAELDWHLLDNPEHKQLQQCYADLNALYRSQTALHDDHYTGTNYSLMDDNGNSVMAFVRRNNGKVFLAAFNCTPQPIYDYTVGVPMPGKWVEIFNTDELKYGGSGVVAQQPVLTTNNHNHGFDQSMSIGMPPLGACFWVLEEA